MWNELSYNKYNNRNRNEELADYYDNRDSEYSLYEDLYYKNTFGVEKAMMYDDEEGDE